MAESAVEIQCPACSHKFIVGPEEDRSGVVCPHCEAEVPESAFRGLAEMAEEIAPGFRPGQQLGNYVIESLLGAGGMAVVFLGRQLSLNRYVAIKILPQKFAENKLFVERFESEAAVLASLNHRNIVSVIDRGQSDATYFIVMEYIQGETVKDRLRKKDRLPPDEVIPIAQQALAGLAYAHKRGVVHRDIKPGNIMITVDGEVKIADFGLAHLAKSQGGLDVTRENQAMGTLKYMAPEQLTSAKHVDGRADLYAFGICLYEMLTGKMPIGTFKTPTEIDSSLDLRWDDLILKALKTEPEDRYQKAEHMLDAINEIASTPKVSARDAEKAEEVQAAQAAAPEVFRPVCAKCGHESAPVARECEKCGASLHDLFDHCPDCRASNRIDIEKCAKCGTDLEEHRRKKLRTAQAVLKRAKQLESQRNYEEAIAEGRKLLKFRTRDYSRLREQAHVWIRRLEERRERYCQRLYEAGRREMAEARHEAALKMWEPLPDAYKDIAHWRKELTARLNEARTALADGSRLYKAGDLDGAVEAWDRAAHFWPHDKALRRQLIKARNELGNRTLMQTYLKEAAQREKSRDFAEARALIARALDLDPNYGPALKMLERIQQKQDEMYEQASAAENRLILQDRRKEKPPSPPNPKVIAAVIAAFLLAGLAFFLFGVYLPGRRAQMEQNARRLLGEAQNARRDKDLNKAITLCDRVMKEFPLSSAASDAEKEAAEMRRTQQEAHALCQSIDADAHKKTFAGLDSAYWRFQEVVKVPPVSEIESYIKYAGARTQEVRREIALLLLSEAREAERRGNWAESLERCRTAAEKYACAGEPVAGALETARKRMADYTQAVAETKALADAGEWERAYVRCREALALAWALPEANDLLERIGRNRVPPEGMVYVPRGTYTVGGAEGNPMRDYPRPRGFYIERTEVTNAQYADFLRATGRPAPPNWTEAGAPPEGAANLPVTLVTWDDARAYAEWAGRILPTEEMWECAARDIKGKRYPWGDRWDPKAGVFAYGPAPVDAAAGDRSFCGALGLAGNVAEWTATEAPLVPPASDARPATHATDAERPKPPPTIVVKGASWAGIEPDRLTRILPAGPGTFLALTPDSSRREIAVGTPSDIQMVYTGPHGRPEDAGVLVRRWSPEWQQWLESRFAVVMGDMIGGIVSFTVQDDREEGRRSRGKFEFSLATGCKALSHDARKALLILDPTGVQRSVPFERVAESRITLNASQRRDLPEPPPFLLESSATAPARMIGRSEARYLNVGFRCALLLWEPPEEKAERNAPTTE